MVRAASSRLLRPSPMTHSRGDGTASACSGWTHGSALRWRAPSPVGWSAGRTLSRSGDQRGERGDQTASDFTRVIVSLLLLCCGSAATRAPLGCPLTLDLITDYSSTTAEQPDRAGTTRTRSDCEAGSFRRSGRDLRPTSRALLIHQGLSGEMDRVPTAHLPQLVWRSKAPRSPTA